jgi:hypothetical protein
MESVKKRDETEVEADIDAATKELAAYIEGLTGEEKRTAKLNGFDVAELKKNLTEALGGRHLSVALLLRHHMATIKDTLQKEAKEQEETKKYHKDVDDALAAFEDLILRLSDEERAACKQTDFSIDVYRQKMMDKYGFAPHQLACVRASHQSVETVVTRFRRVKQQRENGIAIVPVLVRYAKLEDNWRLFIRGRLGGIAGRRFDSEEFFMGYCGTVQDWTQTDGEIAFLDAFDAVLQEIATCVSPWKANNK